MASAHEPWLEEVLGNRTPNDQWLSMAPNGHVVAQRMAGPIIVGVAFYALLDRVSNPDGFNLVVGGIAAAALTATTVMLLFLALRRSMSTQLALAAALVFGLATPTWSVSANGLWTHTVTQLGIAGAAWAATRSQWTLAGTFVAFGMLGRPHLALIAAVLGVGVAYSRRDFRPALGIAVPTVSSLGILAAWNHWMFGPWSIGGAYGDDRLGRVLGDTGRSQIHNLAGFLVAPDRGLLIWTPVLLLLLPSLVRAWSSIPDWSRWLIAGGLVYTAVQLRFNSFDGGDTYYGYRYGLELITCLAPGLAFSIPWIGRLARALAPPVIALQVAVIAVGAERESFFVPIADVWHDNGFLVALERQPVTIGLMLAAFLATGVVESVIINQRLEQGSPGGHRVKETQERA